MVRAIVFLGFLLANPLLVASDQNASVHPSFDYNTAREHEIKPHRRVIPLEGVREGFSELRLTLTVSPAGDVMDAEAKAIFDTEITKFWPQIEDEVRLWKFTPFEQNGAAVTAEVEEYVGLVPPERRPKNHVPAPALRPGFKVAITLQRSGCFGTCPSYTVTVSTDGILFDGEGYVVAPGKHTDKVNVNEVRKLAKKFIAADFYSLDAIYRAGVTDNPTYVLSIAIDGQTKEVEDYVGARVGMPAVISELEEAVDALAGSERWVEGSDGLVQALQAEKFNFHTFVAQVMLKEAATRGKTATVSELLEAGVPLEPLPDPKVFKQHEAPPFQHVGWLNSASRNPEALQVLIDAGASKNDQSDKDQALGGAANAGHVESVEALIAYGANPNADLRNGTGVRESSAGSVLFYAAASGNPEMVREILRYHPRLETRDSEGKTAMFAAADYGNVDTHVARVECVSLLAQAGANVNARDNNGNAPLHETSFADVQEELLKRGADVNAQNKKGETPIFTAYNDEAIPLFVRYGADLSIRNSKGETVMEAAKDKGPEWQAALQKAIPKSEQPQ